MKQSNYLFTDTLVESDQTADILINEETTRQSDKLVMIPSESLCPPAVRQALATVFSHKYAEGYPSLRMTVSERQRVEEGMERYLAFHRRYGDRRFYKGAEFCNMVEVLAQKRAAEIFATKDVPAEKIFVNVQPLSGAAANNAVYNAFVVPGDVIMGMSLSYGGHLSHGSPFNRSGRQYKVISYTVDMATGKLNYEEIEKLAQEHKPKIIIAGASAYPWGIDWARLSEIARDVPVQIPGLVRSGAVLLADISHPAGLVVAGYFPNPIGYADVITLTTHKTMCGPRGAIILSTNEEIARRIDLGVFPGEQGGPHLNNILAKAVCFKLAATERFKELQKRIVDNCQSLAAGLQKLGIKLAYGGTNSHMVLIDLGGLSHHPKLTGDVASNILDLCGITANKNALPGDETGARPRGIRFGTPILSQRGMGKSEMEKIAGLIHKVLTNIRTFKVMGMSGEIVRGKIPLDVVEEVKGEVKKLTDRFPIKESSRPAGQESSRPKSLEIVGERATAFLQTVLSADVYGLIPNQTIKTLMYDSKGREIASVILQCLTRQHYRLTTDKLDKVNIYLAGLSDGFILFDDDDIYLKVEGPVVLKQVTSDKLQVTGAQSKIQYSKPYFIGQKALLSRNPKSAIRNSQFTFKPDEGEPRKTALYEEHLKLTKKQFVVSFAGWALPVWYTRASEEHSAVRQTAGLFDVSHMGKIEITGDYATRFLDLVTTNYVAKLRNGQAHYSYILSPDGNVLDDIFLYRMEENHYLMIVNAANAEKIWQWLNAVNERKVVIDNDHVTAEIEDKVTLKDSRYGTAPKGQPGQIINMALQGPESLKILLQLLKNEPDKDRLIQLKKSHFAEFDFNGIKAISARTGYTGEEVGFEIMVPAEQATRFWEMLLRAGAPFGLKPCGLAARDSLRTEAGLPLYGHELSGVHNIIPIESGYGAFVKLHKPFFIGRRPYLLMAQESRRQLFRFQITTSGARAVKPGDPVVNRKGEYIGVVTSCALAGTRQVGLALMYNKVEIKEGTSLRIFPLPPKEREKTEKPKRQLQVGDSVLVPEEAVVVARFPLRKLLSA